MEPHNSIFANIEGCALCPTMGAMPHLTLDMRILNFTKAFNTVPRQRLLMIIIIMAGMAVSYVAGYDLTLFYLARNGHIEIPLPPYVIPVKRNDKSHWS